MEPNPCDDVEVREAELATAGASKPVPILEADLKDAVETLRLLGVTCMRVSLLVSITSVVELLLRKVD